MLKYIKLILGKVATVFETEQDRNSYLRTWARIEYGKDWKHAYEYMKENNGQPPRYNDNLKGWV